MADALGEQLLIDLYACKEENLSSPHDMQQAVADALIKAELKIDELSCQANDDEVIITAIAPRFHLMLHAYLEMGYIAADLFSFEKDAPLSTITKELRSAFGAEKMKSTSIQRGDFGSVRDMKPRRQTKITALGRVTRSRIQIKNTGEKLIQPGVKAVKAVAKKAKIKK
ncbi:MAG: S-adenosylmethionine decarboxylase [Veillonella sp.]|mgnify:FL=1|nr:S-adenosylmethionine decarboxylase [Veillonella sp.]